MDENPKDTPRMIEEKQKNVWNNLSISTWPIMLEEISISHDVLRSHMYFIFTFERLHNIHLVWSKVMKTRFVSYLYSCAVLAERNGK